MCPHWHARHCTPGAATRQPHCIVPLATVLSSPQKKSKAGSTHTSICTRGLWGVLAGYQKTKPQSPLGQPLSVHLLGSDLPRGPRGSPPWAWQPGACGVRVWPSRSWRARWGRPSSAPPKSNQRTGKNTWRHLTISYLDKGQLLIFETHTDGGWKHCGHFELTLGSPSYLLNRPARLSCRQALVWAEQLKYTERDSLTTRTDTKCQRDTGRSQNFTAGPDRPSCSCLPWQLYKKTESETKYIKKIDKITLDFKRNHENVKIRHCL